MPLAMWAKSAAGTNITFLKGFSRALKSWREILQQAVQRKPVPKPKVQKLDLSHAEAKEKCLFQPGFQYRSGSTLQSRIFRSIFSRTASKTMASELRRISALRLSSSSARSFKNVPIMSLIGVTLGVDFSSLIDDSGEKMMAEMRAKFRDYTWEVEPLEKLPQSLGDLDINLQPIANGCEGAVYMAKVKADAAISVETTEPLPREQFSGSDDYNLAVKAVFNYGAESNSQSILRALEREVVPVRVEGCLDDSTLSCQMKRLPPHPNIVDMPGMFVDDMLVTEEGKRNFPAALPHRLNPELYWGRNKTLYLVMKRRSTHLQDYLATHNITMETRCLMLAQLLEGVAHMWEHGIAHRDLKSNNVLVDEPSCGGPCRLEICDFGCCLAEENKSLKVPFPTHDTYMGGNSWLMAPEVVTAVPGPNSYLDFSRSDLWAAGAIAYEILGGENPFYLNKGSNRPQLSSRSYREDELPCLPESVPDVVKRLVKSLLSRDPRKRPSPRVAATVAQMVVLETHTVRMADICVEIPRSSKKTTGSSWKKDPRPETNSPDCSAGQTEAEVYVAPDEQSDNAVPAHLRK